MKLRVKVPGTRSYVAVTIASDAQDMLATKKKLVGLEKGDEKAVSFFCASEKFNISKKTGEKLRAPMIANIILNMDALSAGVVSQMMIHAAINADRVLFGNKKAMFGMKVSEKELRLVSIAGNMMDSLTTQMNNAGL